MDMVDDCDVDTGVVEDCKVETELVDIVDDCEMIGDVVSDVVDTLEASTVEVEYERVTICDVDFDEEAALVLRRRGVLRWWCLSVLLQFLSSIEWLSLLSCSFEIFVAITANIQIFKCM